MSQNVHTSDPPPGESETGPGTPDSEGGDEQSRLRALFVDVTGTEEVVDERESTAGSRYLEGAATDVSEYVTDVARNDGLAEAVDDLVDTE